MATNQDVNVLVNVRGEEKINRLAASFDRLNVATARGGQSIIGTGNALKSLDTQLRATGRRYAEIGRFITRNFSAPLLVSAGVAAKMGFDFEKSVSRIASLGGAAAEDIKGLTKEVLALSGSTLTAGPKDLAEALYFIRSSGFDAAEGMAVLEAANKGARIGMGETKVVADAVTSAMNAYGHATMTAERTVDVFTSTVRVGKAEPEELARAIGFVIPIAAQLGVELTEVGGLIAAMTLQGLKASTAVTGLRALLTTFTRGLPITQKALSLLGFSLTQIQESIRKQGLAPTLNTIRQAVDRFDKSGGQLAKNTLALLKKEGPDAAQKMLKLRSAAGDTAATILSQLFPNVRALNAFLINTGKNAPTTARTIGEVGDSAGETAKKFDEIRKQNWAQFSEVWNKLRSEFTKIGVQVLPIFTSLLNAILKVVKAMSFDWAGPFKFLGPLLKGNIALLGVMLVAIGPLIAGWGQLIRLQSVIALRRAATVAKEEAAAARQVAALTEVSAATTRQAETATLAAAATVKGVDAGTAAYARQAIAVDALAIQQARQARVATGGALATVVSGAAAFGGGPVVRGPGGEFISPKSAEGVAAVRREAGLATRSMYGLRASIAAAAGALSLLWPIAAIEGALLLYMHWDDVSKKIFEAGTNLDRFVDKLPGKGKLDALKDAVGGALGGIRDVPGIKQLGDVMAKQPELLKTWEKAFALGGPAFAPLATFLKTAFDNGKKLANEVKKVAPEGKKNKDWLAEMAKNLGISEKELRRILGLTKSTNAELNKAAQAFDTVWDRLVGDMEAVFNAATDKMLEKFDATTERMVENMKVTVRVMGRTFTIGRGQKTPAEREAEALDRTITLLRLRNDLMDAGRAIIAATAMGSPTALREAQQAAAEARAGIRGVGLGTRADRERRAADKALDAGERRLRARRGQQRREIEADRALELRHMQDELQTLRNQLVNRKITIAEFNTKLKALMGSYGVTASDGAKLIGKAFGTGMEESLRSVGATIKRFAADLGKEVAKAVKTSLKPVGDLLDAGAAILEGRKPGPTTPAGSPARGPGRAGGPAGPPTPGVRGTEGRPPPLTAVQYLRRRYRRLLGRGLTSEQAAYQLYREHASQFSENTMRRFLGLGPRLKQRPGEHPKRPSAPATPEPGGGRGYATGGLIPGMGPKAITAHGGELIIPKGGKLPKWLRDEMQRATKLIARRYVLQSQLAARAASGKKVSVEQIYGAQVPRLQKMMVAAQKGRAVAGGEDAYLQKQAMLASSPVQAGLIKTRPGKTDILGPAGRSGRARAFSGADVSRAPGGGTQNVTINIYDARNPKKVAAAVRTELQKTASRNARKMRGRNAGQRVGAG